jgi:hypothetical protein
MDLADDGFIGKFKFVAPHSPLKSFTAASSRVEAVEVDAHKAQPPGNSPDIRNHSHLHLTTKKVHP